MTDTKSRVKMIEKSVIERLWEENIFGASAPPKVLFQKFGFTVEEVVNRAEMLLTDK